MAHPTSLFYFFLQEKFSVTLLKTKKNCLSSAGWISRKSSETLTCETRRVKQEEEGGGGSRTKPMPQINVVENKVAIVFVRIVIDDFICSGSMG